MKPYAQTLLIKELGRRKKKIAIQQR